MKKGVFITLLTFVVPLLLLAQGQLQGPQELSLKQAVEFSIEHNKQLQASQKDIEIYKQKVREAISQGLPQVNGTLDYNTNFGYKMDFGGNVIKMKDQSNVTVGLDQLIFSGQWILGIQTSRVAEQLANQQVGITELDIKESIYNTYYLILVSEKSMELVRQNLENMDKVYKHTQNMYNAGTVEITDVDQIRITVGQLKNNLLSLERTVDVNYNLFRLQLGLQAGAKIKLTDLLESFLNDQRYAKLATETFEINNNIEFQMMQTQEELNKKMVGLQKWTYAPTISGRYSFNHKILKPSLDMSPKHTAGFTMNIPVFSGLQRKAQLEQAKIELEKTTINKSLLEDQLYLEEEQYKFELKNAIENYNLQNENISVAKRVLENIQRKYEQGVVSSLDLTQANNNYIQAENNYTSSCLTLLQAQTKLERLYNQLGF